VREKIQVIKSIELFGKRRRVELIRISAFYSWRRAAAQALAELG
jgi:hypothetical protein